jgi:hypothetical protein
MHFGGVDRWRCVRKSNTADWHLPTSSEKAATHQQLNGWLRWNTGGEGDLFSAAVDD